MQHSETITKISADYLLAQKEIENAVKDSNNPFFKSKYADLNSVIEACKKALNDHNISVLQPVMGDVVETILLHSSGEWFSSETKIINAKPNDPQAQGSAITYARRYGLQSMVFIGAEDDDGESAVEREPQKPAYAQKTVSEPKSGLSAYCKKHGTEMRQNKNGNFFHMRNNLKTRQTEFCNGKGFPGENVPVDETPIQRDVADVAADDFEKSLI